jgi:hypothetical protein
MILMVFFRLTLLQALRMPSMVVIRDKEKEGDFVEAKRKQGDN